MSTVSDSEVDTFVGVCKHRKRRLSFDDSALANDSCGSKNICPIQVYARLKPLTGESAPININEDGRSLNYMKLDKSKRPNVFSYSFTQVFDDKTSQNELFRSVVEPNVKKFLSGQNSLLFTFGTSNSGKTFTIQGNALNPGIIPRTLYMIFMSLDELLIENSHVCPDKSSSCTHLTQEARHSKKVEMEKIFRQIMVGQSNSLKSKRDEKGRESLGKADIKDVLSKLSYDVRGIQVSSKAQRAIWVSYYEIYNDSIYDLLNGERKVLSLGLDFDRTYYVKGLRWYNVSSWQDAYRLFLHGRNNLMTGKTSLNQSSSRSHSLYTLKLLCKEDGEQLKVTSLTISDLAGSERVARTNNEGSRLTESKWINKSLMVLNRCFEAIRYNCENKTNKRVVPLRDSKLTQVLQKELTNHGSIAMVVNVNPSIELIEETTTVLRASAIVKDIKISLPKMLHINPRSRMSILCRATDTEMTQLLPVMSEFEDHLKNNGGSCGSDIRKLKEELIKMQSGNIKLQERLDTISSITSGRESCESAVAALSVKKMDREVKQHKDTIDKLERDKQYLKKQNQALLLAVTDARNEILQINQQLHEKLQEIMNLELRLDEKSEKITMLEESIAVKEKNLDLLNDYAKGLQEELGEARRHLKLQASNIPYYFGGEAVKVSEFPGKEPDHEMGNLETSRWSDISTIDPVVCNPMPEKAKSKLFSSSKIVGGVPDYPEVDSNNTTLFTEETLKDSFSALSVTNDDFSSSSERPTFVIADCPSNRNISKKINDNNKPSCVEATPETNLPQQDTCDDGNVSVPPAVQQAPHVLRRRNHNRNEDCLNGKTRNNAASKSSYCEKSLPVVSASQEKLSVLHVVTPVHLTTPTDKVGRVLRSCSRSAPLRPESQSESDSEDAGPDYKPSVKTKNKNKQRKNTKPPPESYLKSIGKREKKENSVNSKSSTSRKLFTAAPDLDLSTSAEFQILGDSKNTQANPSLPLPKIGRKK